MKDVFHSDMSEILHPVLFKTEIVYKTRGRRRGMQFLYWVEVVSKQYLPDICFPRPHRLRTLQVCIHLASAEKPRFWADAKATLLARMALAKGLIGPSVFWAYSGGIVVADCLSTASSYQEVRAGVWSLQYRLRVGGLGVEGSGLGVYVEGCRR